MNDVDRRINRAAEAILTNERLTADLDDEPAQLLLNWGLAWAQMIAESTAGLDKAAAKSIMKPRLKALRRLMRTVNRWAGARESMDAAADRVLLSKVYERALLAATASASPNGQTLEWFVDEAGAFRGAPIELITDLRAATEIAVGLKDDPSGASHE
jgi:hypothetical protein